MSAVLGQSGSSESGDSVPTTGGHPTGPAARAELDAGSATFDAPRCRFCGRTEPIWQGTYTRIQFEDGISLVCSDCEEKAD